MVGHKMYSLSEMRRCARLTVRAGFVGSLAALAFAAGPASPATFEGKNGKIAYGVGVGAPDPGLFTMSADGRDKDRLSGHGTHPSWRSDGRKIAYVRGPELWVARANGSRAHRILDGKTLPGAKGQIELGFPSWSPNGKKIAFSVGCRGRTSEAFTS